MPSFSKTTNFFCHKIHVRGGCWRDSSAVQSIGCSSTGPRINCQQPHGSSLSITPVLEFLTPSCRHTCRQNINEHTHTHTRTWVPFPVSTWDSQPSHAQLQGIQHPLLILWAPGMHAAHIHTFRQNSQMHKINKSKTRIAAIQEVPDTIPPSHDPSSAFPWAGNSTVHCRRLKMLQAKMK